jgi:hypothetical protein
VSAPLPPSPAELGPLFHVGERIANAEEFAAAVLRVQERHGELCRYLNALRRAQGGDGIQDAKRYASSVLYQVGHTQRNKYEKSLITLTNQIKRNLELYPFWLAAPRKLKDFGTK